MYLAESFEVMMVETTDGFDKKAENGLESAYPQPGENLADFQEKCRVSMSKALLCPICSVVFDEKAAKRLDSRKKALKDEKHVVPRFVFDKRGAPGRNKEYMRQFPTSLTKDFPSANECSTGEVGKIREPKGGQ